jgi:hypothetical protein
LNKIERMKQKIYAPVTEFERQTSYCPLYLAWRILDEARDYFRTSWVPSPGSATLSHQMGEGLADKLAHRAEAVFAHHPFMQRQFKSASGRAAILMFMRHWLAGVLAKERPALFHGLPESFKVGEPLPPSDSGTLTRSRPLTRPMRAFASGKLLSPLPKRLKSPIRWAKGLPVERGYRRAGLGASKRSDDGSRGRSPHHLASRHVHGCELLAI